MLINLKISPKNCLLYLQASESCNSYENCPQPVNINFLIPLVTEIWSTIERTHFISTLVNIAFEAHKPASAYLKGFINQLENSVLESLLRWHLTFDVLHLNLLIDLQLRKAWLFRAPKANSTRKKWWLVQKYRFGSQNFEDAESRNPRTTPRDRTFHRSLTAWITHKIFFRGCAYSLLHFRFSYRCLLPLHVSDHFLACEI